MILVEEEIQYQGGDFTVIPSNFLHTTNSAPGRLSSWEYLFVDVEKLIEKATAGVPGRMEKLMRRINNRATLVSSEKYPYLGEQIRTIMNIMRGGEAFCQEEAEALMTALLMEVARRNGDGTLGEVKNSGGVKSGNLIFRVLDYISDHYSEPLKVGDIAKWAHISETHFRRVFLAHMNMSPLEYINLVRIQAACEYLKKTDEPVAMIAAKCGFTVSSTFNRNFLQIMGVTPAQWRNRPENYEQQILKYQIRSEEGW